MICYANRDMPCSICLTARYIFLVENSICLPNGNRCVAFHNFAERRNFTLGVYPKLHLCKAQTSLHSNFTYATSANFTHRPSTSNTVIIYCTGEKSSFYCHILVSKSEHLFVFLYVLFLIMTTVCLLYFCISHDFSQMSIKESCLSSCNFLFFVL